ncbi:MAG: gamma-glutamylcyclotransferase [Alphaproteobacteria bacterium]|nr:gamma-glutamylcyclotransferase [Alphaproteobacteria bacterium]
MRYFFFGTLRDREIMAAVIGRPPPEIVGLPAVLRGYRRVVLREEPFPALVPDPTATVDGLVINWLTGRDLDRILFYESIEYTPVEAMVSLARGRSVRARLFVDTGAIDFVDAPWDFDDWRVTQKRQDLELTRMWMEFYGFCDVVMANRLWDDAVAESRPIENVIRSLKSTSSDP